MVRFRYFESGPGALTISIKAKGWVVFDPALSLIIGNSFSPVQRSGGANGIYDFSLTEEQVETLLSEPDVKKLPCLAVQVMAVLHPGAPDRKWGWATRASRNGTSFPAFNPNGTQLPRDAAGFAPAAERTIDDNANYSSGFEFVGLT